MASAPFIPCKPPLCSEASEHLEEGDRCVRSLARLFLFRAAARNRGLTMLPDGCRFDATMFMDKQVNARRNVGLVVSLTDPSKGIPTPGEKEWEDWDAELKVIKPVSAEQVAQEFQKVVRTFWSNKSNATRMVAVFCEDGTNLTGYAIISYMHQAMGVPLSTALAQFAGARDPGIFHAPYIQDLYQRFAKGDTAPSAPAAPSWALDASILVPARGDFALPATRHAPLPVLPGPAAASSTGRASNGEGSKAAEKAPSEGGGGGGERLPAGWTKHWSKTHNRPYYFNKATGKQSWDPPPGGGSGGGGAEKPAGGKMGALHILYKHQKSRKTGSWKDPEGTVIKARSVSDARSMLQNLRDELEAQERSSGTALRQLFSERARSLPPLLSPHIMRKTARVSLAARAPPVRNAAHTSLWIA